MKTEAEAKAMWCCVDRSLKCMASQCMAWVWEGEHFSYHTEHATKELKRESGRKSDFGRCGRVR